MIERLLQIDTTTLKDKANDDLIRIKFSSEDFLQVNFTNFFIKSKYIRDKYKYYEALDSLQDEIDEIENKFHINERSLKYFIRLIDEEKVNIPIEHYKDIYTLSEYFCVPKFITILDKISQEELLNDLDFTIQILNDSETSKNCLETKLTSKIEKFLGERINECIENAKFRELQVSTICRIVEKSKEKVNHNKLIDFILESAKTRFVLFRCIDIEKLADDKIEELIKFFDEQEEDSKRMYYEYMTFNLSIIKNMKNKYNQLLNEMKQTKHEFKQLKTKYNQTEKDLKQTKYDFEEIKTKYEQTKNELSDYKKRTKQAEDEINRIKSETKQYTKFVFVGGYNGDYRLGEKPNNKAQNGNPIISPHVKLSFDSSSLLSYSTYCHSVLVTSDGSLNGVGYNVDGRISATFQNTVIDHFTDFCIKDGSGHQLAAISAVCCLNGTLYMFSKSDGSGRQLVLCDRDIKRGDPVFLDIGNHHPVSLFGGCLHSLVIGSEGEVIFINRNSVKNSPNSPIAVVFLPEGEKASSAACCDDSIVVLSSNGRVFTSPAKKENSILKFAPVSELSNEEIVCVSGTFCHILAVSKEGRVFGCGSNEHGKLGLGEGTESVSSFTEIRSLVGYEIRAAYAGSHHSLFETREGKILSCGRNEYGELLLSSGPSEDVYLPTETTIANGCSFCIAGNCTSTVFIGSGPPPNTPNIRIHQFH